MADKPTKFHRHEATSNVQILPGFLRQPPGGKSLNAEHCCSASFGQIPREHRRDIRHGQCLRGPAVGGLPWFVATAYFIPRLCV